MIADQLTSSNLYNSMSPYFEKCFDFIKTLDEETKNGEYLIQEGVKAIVMEYDTVVAFKHGWEAHEKYIDIQYCLRGKERIQWSPISKVVPTTEYDKEKDCTFYHGPGLDTFIHIGNGIFAIFFPNDAHAPQMLIEKSEFIKKVVIKVPVSAL